MGNKYQQSVLNCYNKVHLLHSEFTPRKKKKNKNYTKNRKNKTASSFQNNDFKICRQIGNCVMNFANQRKAGMTIKWH